MWCGPLFPSWACNDVDAPNACYTQEDLDVVVELVGNPGTLIADGSTLPQKQGIVVSVCARGIRVLDSKVTNCGEQ